MGKVIRKAAQGLLKTLEHSTSLTTPGNLNWNISSHSKIKITILTYGFQLRNTTVEQEQHLAFLTILLTLSLECEVVPPYHQQRDPPESLCHVSWTLLAQRGSGGLDHTILWTGFPSMVNQDKDGPDRC